MSFFITKFWNSDRNHRPKALREMFSSLQHSLGRHSLFDLTCCISSGVTVCVRYRPGFTVFRIKLSKTHASLSNSMQFWGCWRFIQIRQRIFNLHKILKLLTYYTPFYHQSLQSYLISTTVQFFWPILYITTPGKNGCVYFRALLSQLFITSHTRPDPWPSMWCK